MGTQINTPGFAHVVGMTAANICERFELSPEATALLNDEDAPERFLSLLRDNGLPDDAVRLVANSQPMAELIHWALACVRVAYPAAPPTREAAALSAVEAWLADPTDPNRRAAFDAGQLAKLENPAGLVATAVYFTGGNIAPPESGQEAPAPPGVAAQLASTAILVAATHGDPAARNERLAEFL